MSIKKHGHRGIDADFTRLSAGHDHRDLQTTLKSWLNNTRHGPKITERFGFKKHLNPFAVVTSAARFLNKRWAKTALQHRILIYVFIGQHEGQCRQPPILEPGLLQTLILDQTQGAHAGMHLDLAFCLRLFKEIKRLIRNRLQFEGHHIRGFDKTRNGRKIIQWRDNRLVCDVNRRTRRVICYHRHGNTQSASRLAEHHAQLTAAQNADAVKDGFFVF